VPDAAAAGGVVHAWLTFPTSSPSPRESRRELRPEQYRVLRQKGSERAFTGARSYCCDDGWRASAQSAGRKRAPVAEASLRCAALVPITTRRAGSMRWRRAKSSRSPGSGGRHQQSGGPAG